MSRLQPVGQKKLTNICVVRYKRTGKRFEVAAYRNTVLAWRNGNQTDLDEVLQAHTIFSNLEKGDIAKSEDLIEAFGTDNEDVVCVEVLNKGEFQVSEEERQAHLEQLFKDVAARVTDMVVNPETLKPYPLSTIERYLRETLHFAPTDKKSAKQQALGVVRQLEQAADFPVMRAQMRLRLRVPDRTAVPRVQQALNELAVSASRAAGGKAAGSVDGSGGGGGSGGGAPERLQVMAPEDLHDETVAIDCLADPGLYRDIGEIATKHSSSLQVLELKAAAQDAGAATASAMAAAPSAAAVSSVSAASGAPTASPATTPSSVGVASAQQQRGGGSGAAPSSARAARDEADDIFARVDGRQARGGRDGGGGKGGGGAAGGKGGGKGGGGKGGGDPEEAARRKAERMFKLNLRNAETGDPVAQLEVGKALLDGVGCEADVSQGRHWLEQASLQGVNAATARLEALALQ